MIISQVIKLANFYDGVGQIKKADRLDAFIQKWSQTREPTPQELMEEEEWLQNEDLSDASLMEGLSPEEQEQAESYLSGGTFEEFKETLTDLQQSQYEDISREQEQAQIMEELSNMFLQNQLNPSPDVLPHQKLPTAESSFVKDLVKLADILDQHKMTKHADFFDKFLSKIAAGEPPEDFTPDGEDLKDLESELDSEDDDFDMEPSTEELKALEKEPDTQFYIVMEFLDKLAQGMFSSLEEAENEAKALITEIDGEIGVPNDGDEFSDEIGFEGEVMEFPSDQVPESNFEGDAEVIPFPVK